MRRDRSARSARSRRVRAAARAAAALAGDRQRRLHRLASARSAAAARPEVVGLDNFATGHQRNLDDVARAVGADALAPPRFIEGDIAIPTRAARPARGVDIVLHQAALGSVPRSIDDPLAHARRQRRRLPQHAGRGARRRRAALRLRGVELDVRRPSRAAEGRGRDRPAAVAVRGDQATSTSSTPTCSRAATACRRSACATSTCSARARIRTARTPR